jgi:hypothetical protein
MKIVGVGDGRKLCEKSHRHLGVKYCAWNSLDPLHLEPFRGRVEDSRLDPLIPVLSSVITCSII